MGVTSSRDGVSPTNHLRERKEGGQRKGSPLQLTRRRIGVAGWDLPHVRGGVAGSSLVGGSWGTLSRDPPNDHILYFIFK